MMTTNLRSTLHRDGSVTIWSVYEQRWTRCAKVSDREYAAMDAAERARVTRHIARHRAE